MTRRLRAAAFIAAGLLLGVGLPCRAEESQGAASAEPALAFPPEVAGGGSDAAAAGQANPAASPIAELEQLLQTSVEAPAMAQEVISVSGQESTVGRSAAAVFVITQDMIRRSGATSIPEALRMAPGIQVARLNSSQWAITARGFDTDVGGLFSTNNKLLVLIDGRTVYTPFFNGTYWDVQDYPLDDIERIEVIRGPGATIWGANAVNGVINVITKRTADTQGVLVKAGGGSEEHGLATVRVGGRTAEDLHYRVYGKWLDRDASFSSTRPGVDDWRQGRGGFRMDWTPTNDDLVTLQGDGYGGADGFFNTAPAVNAPDDEHPRGGNLLARWTRTFSDESDMSLQCYYDRADRINNLGFLDQEFNTYDVDFRHRFPLDVDHHVIWGLGYRVVNDRIESLTAPPARVLRFDPTERTYDTVSMWAQDEITLTNDAWFTAGVKVQHNDFSGWEAQPTARLLYSPEATWAAWASVSRAVRTPSRIEEDGVLAAGVVPFLDFDRSFDAEELIAYELGYRTQPETWWSWDVATFFNQYQRLASLRTTPVTLLPIVDANDNCGEGYGAELSAQVDMLPTWHVRGSYSFLQLQIHPGALAVDFLGARGTAIEGSSPHNQVYVMSSHDLGRRFEIDAIGRYVDNLPFVATASYIEMDLRMAWRPGPQTELAVAGQNLLDSHHAEFAGGNEIQRGVYGMVTQRW